MSSEDLDFALIFEDGTRAAGPDHHVRTSPSFTHTLQAAAPTDVYRHVGPGPQGPLYSAPGNPRAFDCPSIHITSIAGGVSHGAVAAEASWCRDHLFLPLDAGLRDPALAPSPGSSLSSRSWMSDLSSCESFSHIYDDVEVELSDAVRLALGSPVGSPGCGGGAFGVELWQQEYQHPAAFSPSLSPLQSPTHSPRGSVTEDNWPSRPTSRPSSRPTSPCGKRRHSGADPPGRSSSPTTTPSASPRGSVTDDTWAGRPAGAPGPPLTSCCQELDVPSKTRRMRGSLGGHLGEAPALEELRQVMESVGEEPRQQSLPELFLQVPSHFSWNKPRTGTGTQLRTLAPPPLDSLLPSRCEQCELTLEVQPRSYHRAHYETEGSRGAIKAAAGGHPLVKLSGYDQQPVNLLLFIGTADERFLRPHAFYQVHRVTGKTVTTACQERLVDGTKVLEVPLLPKNNMSASIDCAGILKLRNADIELQKGETDIGRKNTRVRIVFRVGVPQTDGRTLWLQTASVPVECSQRSGQDRPQVDRFSPTSCSVEGGAELLISGSNLCPQSRVVFTERGPDGRSLWEEDARVLVDRSSSSNVVVVIPSYSRTTSCPVHVKFYVSTGKRRRSAAQSFTFLPPVVPAPVKDDPLPLPHRALIPDLLPYSPCDLALLCGSAPLNTPRVMFPPPSSLHLSPTPIRLAARPTEGRSFKREPEEQQCPESLCFHEITLDDVNEVIDRDIGTRVHWDEADGDAALTFCGSSSSAGP